MINITQAKCNVYLHVISYEIYFIKQCYGDWTVNQILLTELFSFPNQLSGGYQESVERTDQPHVPALRFFPNWRF